MATSFGDGTYYTVRLGRTPVRVAGPNPWRKRITAQARGADAYISNRIDSLNKATPDGLRVTRDLPAIDVGDTGEMWAVAGPNAEPVPQGFTQLDHPTLSRLHQDSGLWSLRDAASPWAAGQVLTGAFTLYADRVRNPVGSGSWVTGGSVVASGVELCGDSIAVPQAGPGQSYAWATPAFAVTAGAGVKVYQSIARPLPVSFYCYVAWLANIGDTFAARVGITVFPLFPVDISSSTNEFTLDTIAPAGATAARICYETVAAGAQGPLILHAVAALKVPSTFDVRDPTQVWYFSEFTIPGAAGDGMRLAALPYLGVTPGGNQSAPIKAWSTPFRVTPGTRIWASVDSWNVGLTTRRHFAIEYGETASFGTTGVVGALTYEDADGDYSSVLRGPQGPEDRPVALTVTGIVPDNARYARVTLGSLAVPYVSSTYAPGQRWYARRLVVGTIDTRGRIHPGPLTVGRNFPRIDTAVTGAVVQGAIAARMNGIVTGGADVEVRWRAAYTATLLSCYVVYTPFGRGNGTRPLHYGPNYAATRTSVLGLGGFRLPVNGLVDIVSGAGRVVPGETLTFTAGTFLAPSAGQKTLKVCWGTEADQALQGPSMPWSTDIIPPATTGAYVAIGATPVVVPPGATVARIYGLFNTPGPVELADIALTRPNASVLVTVRFADSRGVVVHESNSVQVITATMADYRTIVTMPPELASAGDLTADVVLGPQVGEFVANSLNQITIESLSLVSYSGLLGLAEYVMPIPPTE